MKIILSRKGFDSSVGGFPSPVLPDGKMLSLPIPTEIDSLSYSNITGLDNRSYQAIIDELCVGGKIGTKGAHLDPDLLVGNRMRTEDWRASLGQIRAAGGHLRNEEVGAGDLFLFYGWFRCTKHDDNGRLQFTGRKNGFHAIYGYLFIQERLLIDEEADIPEWLMDHPHSIPKRRKIPNNYIYVAQKKAPMDESLPGAGVFAFDKNLVLTKDEMSRSKWNLHPGLFRHLYISYHKKESWKEGYFQSFPRAQEYVIHADQPVVDWALKLISSNPGWVISS